MRGRGSGIAVSGRPSVAGSEGQVEEDPEGSVEPAIGEGAGLQVPLEEPLGRLSKRAARGAPSRSIRSCDARLRAFSAREI